MESKSKSQMRRLEAQIPDYKALIRVVRAAKEWAEYCPPKKRAKRGQAIVDALEALPEHLRGEG